MGINLTVKFFFMGLLAVAFVGCSSGIARVPISGRVIVEDGASPTQGEIVFTSSDYTERAQINVDGTFQVELPKASYRLIFLGTTIQEYASNAPPTHIVPRKYTDLTTTDLTLDIQEANQEVTIRIPAADSEQG